MKNILTSLAIAAALAGCSSQGDQQDAQGAQENQSSKPQTVVRNYSLQIANQDTASIGRCGDKFTLALSRVSATAAPFKDVRAEFSIDGHPAASLQDGDSVMVLDTRALRCGVLPVTVRISQEGAQDEYIAASIQLFSDITPKKLGYKVIKAFSHDRGAYTQGLVVEDGHFYESTGLKGKSSLRKVGIEKGDVQQSIQIEDEYFGEGLAMVGDRLYQLTWQNHKAFAYDKSTFGRVQEFYLPTEGWGLVAIAPDTLALTDGSCNLHLMSPGTFADYAVLQVYDNLGPVDMLNELEMYHGHLLMNIYQSNTIAEVDYRTGKVLSYIDLSGLLPDNLRDRDTDVLNGIAYDASRDELYVTGKNWPRLYKIKIQ